jgi:purine-binding chemotaxis protein CheW
MIDNKKSEKMTQVLLIYIENQVFGLGISDIRDILFDQVITPIPLAQPEVMGAINLRGNIVTVLNMRKIFGFPNFANQQKKTHLIIQHKDELLDLVADKVGEVISFESKAIQKTPIPIDSEWQKIIMHVVRQKNSIVNLLNTDEIVSLLRR